MQLAPETGFATVVKSDRQHLTDGSFLGIASVTATDGSQRATGVTILPEAQRASAEGQFDWDLPSTATGSKMTKAAIEALETAARYDLALGRVGFTGRFGGLYPIYVRGLAYLAARQTRL